MEITIKDLWSVLKKSLIFIIIFALLCGIAAYVYTDQYVQKVYVSSLECILMPKEVDLSESTDPDGVVMTPMEQLNNYLVVGGKAIKTLSNLLMSEDTMALVIKYLDTMRTLNPGNRDYITDYQYTAASLRGSFSFEAPKEETNMVFRIVCSANSAHDTQVLLSAFSAVMNERAESFYGDDTFYLEPNEEPKVGGLDSPHIKRVTAIATAVGAFLPYLAALVITLFNSRIKKEEDIKNNFEYPLLGRIPHF